MDGGTVWNVNIDSAIRQCLEVVDDESDIIVDIAICDDDTISPVDPETEGTIWNFFRSYNIHDFYDSSD